MESRAPSQDVVSKIMSFPRECGECSGREDLTGAESKAIASSIYLTASIALPFLTSGTDKHGLYIRVSSKGLPVGAGLGSSAALSVATSAGLLRLKTLVDEKERISNHSACSNLLGDVHSPNSSEEGMVPSDKWLQCINEWSFAAEVVMTGTPSGIDNTVSCFGNAVRYRRGSHPGQGPSIDYLKEFKGIKLLITDTKVPRETKVLVGNVLKLKESSKSMGLVLDSIFDSIESVTESFLSNVELSSKAKTENIKGDNVISSSMQQLVRINQELLNSIGVGHKALDTVCRLGRRHGFETKLTGAGMDSH